VPTRIAPLIQAFIDNVDKEADVQLIALASVYKDVSEKFNTIQQTMYGYIQNQLIESLARSPKTIFVLEVIEQVYLLVNNNLYNEKGIIKLTKIVDEFTIRHEEKYEFDAKLPSILEKEKTAIAARENNATNTTNFNIRLSFFGDSADLNAIEQAQHASTNNSILSSGTWHNKPFNQVN
jgi:hypothetical protein